jgi:ubiquinone/menaquinone biosynthesis C-methylase UbiE
VSFDRVASHYRWLETLVFGNQLQQARVAFMREIGSPRRVLIVGEGDGRFLAEFVRSHPAAAVDCIEASGQMIELARRSLDPQACVNFIQTDIGEAELAPNFYDLVVTHFFLDCLGEGALAAVIVKLANSATPDAQWLVADFSEPSKSWRRLPARFLIALMYFFFRLAAGIEARQLVDYRPLLQAEGFVLAEALQSPNEIIRSERWRRRTSPPG